MLLLFQRRPTASEVERKERRKEQNRRAAQKCRQKKKLHAKTVVQVGVTRVCMPEQCKHAVLFFLQSIKPRVKKLVYFLLRYCAASSAASHHGPSCRYKPAIVRKTQAVHPQRINDQLLISLQPVCFFYSGCLPDNTRTWQKRKKSCTDTDGTGSDLTHGVFILSVSVSSQLPVGSEGRKASAYKMLQKSFLIALSHPSK